MIQRLLLGALLLLSGRTTLAQTTVAGITEGTSASWQVDFTDETGAPTTPETVTYQIATMGTTEAELVVLVPTTDVTPGPTVTIVSPPVVMPNVNLRNPNLPPTMPCAMTVHFSWAGGTKENVSYATFPLRNAPGWPFPATPTPGP